MEMRWSANFPFDFIGEWFLSNYYYTIKPIYHKHFENPRDLLFGSKSCFSICIWLWKCSFKPTLNSSGKHTKMNNLINWWKIYVNFLLCLCWTRENRESIEATVTAKLLCYAILFLFSLSTQDGIQLCSNVIAYSKSSTELSRNDKTHVQSHCISKRVTWNCSGQFIYLSATFTFFLQLHQQVRVVVVVILLLLLLSQ